MYPSRSDVLPVYTGCSFSPQFRSPTPYPFVPSHQRSGRVYFLRFLGTTVIAFTSTLPYHRKGVEP